MLELQRLRADHLDAVHSFELDNRDYFTRFISDRGDEFYAAFAEHYDAQLSAQQAGACAFHVLVDDCDGTVVGRFNLYEIGDGAAEVGYRLAERAAGRGVATSALIELCRRAADEYGLRVLRAGTSEANRASQRVLEKAGFLRDGAGVVAGKPGVRFARALP